MHPDRRATSANDRRYEADKKAIPAHGKRMSFEFGSRGVNHRSAPLANTTQSKAAPADARNDVNKFSHENICADPVSTIKFIRRLGY
jgi:hypothetical protein